MAVLREIVIGTDCDVRAGLTECTEAQEALVPKPPSLVEVEEHVASIRLLVENGDAPITASNIDLIDMIIDRLDQVYYWAVEEGATFSREPSVLAQCEVPRLMVACVTTWRPKVVTAALRIMKSLLRHEQSCAHLFAEAEKVTMGADSRAGGAPPYGGVGLYGLLAGAMGCFAGLVELQSEAAAVAAEAAPFDVEGLLDSEVISHVLAALERHCENTVMQREVVRLFSTLVDIERNASRLKGEAMNATAAVESDGSQLTPVAVIFCHTGVVLNIVLNVARRHANNVEIKRNAIHFFNRCASFPENSEVILQCGVYGFLVAALSSTILLPEIFAEVTEAIAGVVPCLDALQRRSLVLVIRHILLKSASTFHVSLCTALLFRLLRRSVQSQREQQRFHRIEVPVVDTRIEENNESGADVQLELSGTIALDDSDTHDFVSEISIPQLLCMADDNFGAEDPVLRRLVGEVVRLLIPELR
ncbi:hypothetical protein ERJ75_000678100 [Trypanosoma vivax]|nr:hypothetical protein ERJ75_000678100 [Trypanosoma vivax]